MGCYIGGEYIESEADIEYRDEEMIEMELDGENDPYNW